MAAANCTVLTLNSRHPDTVESEQPAPVSATARACLISFDGCIDAATSVDLQRQSSIEDQIARFSIWTFNMEVFAEAKASLDHRLREVPEVRDMVVGLLGVLNRLVQQLSAFLASLGDPLLQIPTRNQLLAGGAFERALQDISSEITLLHELSNTIRKAGRKTQDARALMDFTMKDVDGNKLEEVYQRAFADNILDRFPECSDIIRMRLASTMVLRRKRILYRRHRHASHPIRPVETMGKPVLRRPPGRTRNQDQPSPSRATEPRPTGHTISQEVRSVVAPTSVKSTTTLAAVDFHNAQAPSVVSNSRTIALGSHEGLVFPHVPRKHIRDRFRLLKEKREQELESRLASIPHYPLYQGGPPLDEASLAQVQSQVAEARAKFQQQLEADWKQCNEAVVEFTCPFCSYALSSADIRHERKWREHVTGDLDAYVCLFEDCDEPEVLWTHSQSWLKHMRKHALRWRCPAKSHRDQYFDSQEDFRAHLVDDHKKKYSDAELALLTDRSRQAAGPLFTSCPLCGETSEKANGKLEEHIAGHLRSLALKSLPPNYDEEDEEVPNNQSSDGAISNRSTIKNMDGMSTPLDFEDNSPSASTSELYYDISNINAHAQDSSTGQSVIPGRNAKLKEKEAAVMEFQARAAVALKTAAALPTGTLEYLIMQGRSLNVVTPEAVELSRVLGQIRWNKKALSNRGVIMPLEDVQDLIEEGKRLEISSFNDHMAYYHDQMIAGQVWEQKAKKLIAAEFVHYPQLEALSNQVKQNALPVSRETLDAVDQILHQQREAHHQILDLTGRCHAPDLRMRPEYSEVVEIQKKLEDLNSKPDEITNDLENERKRHEGWIRKGMKLFGKSNSPLHIFKSHLEYMLERNIDCFDIEHDIPRLPGEPVSREVSPEPGVSRLEDPRSRQVFCICRRIEAGMMIECELCHEWYHFKCLKIAREMVKEDDKYMCPICDWRMKIPRDAARPKLEDLMALSDEIPSLPFQPEEEEVLHKVIDNAQSFRNHIAPFCNPLLSTKAEATTQRFFLRKLEGAEVILIYETNFFRQELHKWFPVAPGAPPILEVSLRTRKPRPTKLQRMLADYRVDNPDDLPEHVKGKAYSLRRKAANAESAAAAAAAAQPASGHNLPVGAPPGTYGGPTSFPQTQQGSSAPSPPSHEQLERRGQQAGSNHYKEGSVNLGSERYLGLSDLKGRELQ